MKIIGITGGIGAGKTELLAYIREKYSCRIILADEAAHQVKEPGQKCYRRLIALLGTGVLAEDGQIDKERMAEKIFSDGNILMQVNRIIHPAVKEYIISEIEKSRTEKIIDFLFIEAALLIEDGYENLVDELWYVYASEPVRRKRLKEFRAYSDKKIDEILKKQLTEEEYKAHCKVIIDNSGKLQDTYRQIDSKLEEYLWQK